MTAKKVDLKAERDAAFSELDIDKIKAYYASFGMPPASSEKLLLAEVHKARLHLACIDSAGKQLSRDWLSENGFTPGISAPPVGAAKRGLLKGIFQRKRSK